MKSEKGKEMHATRRPQIVCVCDRSGRHKRKANTTPYITLKDVKSDC
jgi:hypothetical protein